jgi:Lrp/AsnC family transcriptional regulator, leucine-responsive regulatory protein
LGKNDPLSETDARLVAILQQDGRRSYAELGTDLGMAGPSAHERVKKLEARGVIRGYSAIVDPPAIGLTVLAFTWVTQAPGTIANDLTPAFAAIPEIEECHHVAGEADYILKIRARGMDHLGEVVRRVQSTPHVFSTETEVVFSTGFEGRPLPTGRGGAGPEPERHRRGPKPDVDRPRTG